VNLAATCLIFAAALLVMRGFRRRDWWTMLALHELPGALAVLLAGKKHRRLRLVLEHRAEAARARQRQVPVARVPEPHRACSFPVRTQAELREHLQRVSRTFAAAQRPVPPARTPGEEPRPASLRELEAVPDLTAYFRHRPLETEAVLSLQATGHITTAEARERLYEGPAPVFSEDHFPAWYIS
jgi:hypothetical protein